MRISELAAAADVPIATVKFYLREGLLPRGTATSATRATYDDTHLARLRLIAALADVRGLPLARVREILSLVDAPIADPVETMGRAIGALPPYIDESGDLDRAKTAIDALGLTWDPRFAAVAQLDAAIRAVQAAGLEWDERLVERYGDVAMRLARDEIAPMSEMDAGSAVTYAVLGTALYEPVLLALRRLAHQHLVSTRAPR